MDSHFFATANRKDFHVVYIQIMATATTAKAAVTQENHGGIRGLDCRPDISRLVNTGSGDDLG